MRIRMTRTFKASDDGVTVYTLRQGETYDIRKERAKQYLKKGLAVEDKKIDRAPETKKTRKSRKRRTKKKVKKK